jgi:hypothetical protein
MEQKCILAVALLSGALAILVGVLGVLGGLVTLGLLTAPGSAPNGNAEVWVGLAFVSICLLGSFAASSMKRRANQIADLRQQVAVALKGSR